MIQQGATKTIALFVGHPRRGSFSHHLADRYQAGAEAAGAAVRRMDVCNMDFQADLTHGYKQRIELEPCLQQWRADIEAAQHLCWVFPMWWGGMPAKMKGVIDRAFLPGFAMNYIDKLPYTEPLLTGRSADVLITSDTPGWYDRFVNGAPLRHQVKKTVLEFAGIKPVRIGYYAAIKRAKPGQLEHWAEDAFTRGKTAV